MKLNLTHDQLAKLAAGEPVASLGLTAEDATAVTAAMEAAKATADKKALDEAAAAAAAKTTTPAAQPSAAMVEFLRTELRDTQAELAKATAAATDSATKLTAATESLSKIYGIARNGIASMQIALGMPDTSAALAEDTLVAEHDRLSKVFAEKFPGARISSTVAKQDGSKEVAKVDHLLAARFAGAKVQF